MYIWLTIYLLGVILSIYRTVTQMTKLQTSIRVIDVIYTLIWSLFSWGTCFVLYIDEIGTFTDKINSLGNKIGGKVIWRRK